MTNFAQNFMVPEFVVNRVQSVGPEQQISNRFAQKLPKEKNIYPPNSSVYTDEYGSAFISSGFHSDYNGPMPTFNASRQYVKDDYKPMRVGFAAKSNCTDQFSDDYNSSTDGCNMRRVGYKHVNDGYGTSNDGYNSIMLGMSGNDGYICDEDLPAAFSPVKIVKNHLPPTPNQPAQVVIHFNMINY